jgi:AcrR family transcriptional regulator
MKTRAAILQTACACFNAQGLSQVTLRDVAAAMGRSYGNITYHFASKEALVLALYDEMSLALTTISGQFRLSDDPLALILEAPRLTFALSLRYLFLYRDYLDVVRGYPAVAAQAQAANAARMAALRQVFALLQSQGLLDPALGDADIDYIMELSGALRTFFFLQITPLDLADPSLEDRYLQKVNRLLLPYLSAAGKTRYHAIMG